MPQSWTSGSPGTSQSSDATEVAGPTRPPWRAFIGDWHAALSHLLGVETLRRLGRARAIPPVVRDRVRLRVRVRAPENKAWLEHRECDWPRQNSPHSLVALRRARSFDRGGSDPRPRRP